VLDVKALFEENAEALKLSFLTGQIGAGRKIASQSNESADLIGHLNLIHPNRIQVAGKPPAIIIADDEIPPAELFSACEREGLALLRTPVSAAQIIEIARAQLSRILAPQTQMHGVFMDVLGMGVLISGESGLGKSELALELITRGHGLIADDVVDFTRVAPDAVEGRCPPLLQNLLEVRGLGLLDIRTIFGETSVRRKMRLKLIVQMIRRSVMDEFERLPLEAMSQEIMGLPIRKVVIPVAAGRNLAVLVEAAVRNTVLSLRGIDTMQEFVERQQAAMRDSQSNSDSKGGGPNGSGHSQ
jgi:HPr kinase/phosphorylase